MDSTKGHMQKMCSSTAKREREREREREKGKDMCPAGKFLLQGSQAWTRVGGNSHRSIKRNPKVFVEIGSHILHGSTLIHREVFDRAVGHGDLDADHRHLLPTLVPRVFVRDGKVDLGLALLALAAGRGQPIIRIRIAHCVDFKMVGYAWFTRL
jgi:hypothetical protein